MNVSACRPNAFNRALFVVALCSLCHCTAEDPAATRPISQSNCRLTGHRSGTDVVANGHMGRGITIEPSNWSSRCLSGQCNLYAGTVNHTPNQADGRSLVARGGVATWYTDFPVVPGKRYQAEVFVRVQTAAKQAAVGIAISSTSQTDPNQGHRLHYRWLLTEQLDWLHIQAEDYVAPPGASTVRLHLHMRNTEDYDDYLTKVWFDDVRIWENDMPTAVTDDYLVTRKPEFSLWGRSPDHRIYEEDSRPSALRDVIRIVAARGETEAFHLAIHPNAQWQGDEPIAWAWTDLQTADAAARIDRSALIAHRVGFVSLTGGANPDIHSPYSRFGTVPDPLPIEASSTLVTEKNNPFWFLLTVPADSPTGIYRTTLALERGTQTLATVPVEVRVRNFQMPTIPSILIESNAWRSAIEAIEGKAPQSMEPYYRNIIGNRSARPA